MRTHTLCVEVGSCCSAAWADGASAQTAPARRCLQLQLHTAAPRTPRIAVSPATARSDCAAAVVPYLLASIAARIGGQTVPLVVCLRCCCCLSAAALLMSSAGPSHLHLHVSWPCEVSTALSGSSRCPRWSRLSSHAVSASPFSSITQPFPSAALSTATAAADQTLVRAEFHRAEWDGSARQIASPSTALTDALAWSSRTTAHLLRLVLSQRIHAVWRATLCPLHPLSAIKPSISLCQTLWQVSGHTEACGRPTEVEIDLLSDVTLATESAVQTASSQSSPCPGTARGL